jgi:murein DD-endopeptidase MepM/ murein hydrolase activator NlpD
MPRRSLFVLVAATAALVVVPSSEPSRSAAAPVTTTGIEPSDASGTVVVERLAAGSATGAERWRLNLDLLVKNTSATATLLLQRVTISYASPGPAAKTVAIRSSVKPGKTYELNVPEDRDHPFPVAASVSVELKFRGYDPYTVTQKLVEYASPAPGGTYPFPARREELPDGWYFSDGQNHVVGTDHRNTAHQRFAYDLSLRRWDGAKWTSKTEKGTGSENTDFLIYGVRLYAVADGTIVKCRRLGKDNVPGVEGSGGNGFWIQTKGTNEYIFYAHMKEGSISQGLCPKESDPVSVPVSAGDYLGLAGNSGSSGGPHLHFEAYVLDANGKSQGRPLHFRNIRVRSVPADFKGGAPCGAGSSDFAVVKRAAVDRAMLVEPLFEPGHRGIARHGVLDDCYQDLASGIMSAGYRPWFVDFYEVAGKTYVNPLYRSGGPTRAAFHGLTGTLYQQTFDEWKAKGYRPVQVESYLRGNEIRYAAIFERSSGPLFAAWHGANAGQHKKSYDDYKKLGYAPVSISVVSLGGQRSYTALMEKKDIGTFEAEWQLSPAQYQKFLTDQEKKSRHLVYLNAYMHDGKPLFVAIVSSKASPKYVARHGMTSDAYQKEYDKWTGQGLRPVAVAGYASGSTHLFAALWR